MKTKYADPGILSTSNSTPSLIKTNISLTKATGIPLAWRLGLRAITDVDDLLLRGVTMIEFREILEVRWEYCSCIVFPYVTNDILDVTTPRENKDFGIFLWQIYK